MMMMMLPVTAHKLMPCVSRILRFKCSVRWLRAFSVWPSLCQQNPNKCCSTVELFVSLSEEHLLKNRIVLNVCAFALCSVAPSMLSSNTFAVSGKCFRTTQAQCLAEAQFV